MVNNNLHDGHRKRMKERFNEHLNFKGFSEHEIMEMLLFYIIPRKNTNDMAHKLINEFGSVKGVLSADILQLKVILPEKTAYALKFFYQVLCHVNNEEFNNLKKLYVNDPKKFPKYLEQLLINEKKEVLKIFSVNRNFCVESVSTITIEDNESVLSNFRQIAKIILNTNCDMVVIAHNHPVSDNEPSPSDIVSTENLISYLKNIDTFLIDHYIVGQNGVFSMRDSGLFLDYE